MVGHIGVNNIKLWLIISKIYFKCLADVDTLYLANSVANDLS